MADWIGITFFVLLIAGVIAGLKALSKPRVSTADEFEKRAAENTTMMGAGMNALQELMNPEAARAKEVQARLKEGRYMKKKKEGKAGGSADEDEEETGEI
jgi:hypothetical protein